MTPSTMLWQDPHAARNGMPALLQRHGPRTAQPMHSEACMMPHSVRHFCIPCSTCLGRPAHAAADAADPDSAPRLGALSLALPDGTLFGGLAPEK
jgi:hypothetical protein